MSIDQQSSSYKVQAVLASVVGVAKTIHEMCSSIHNLLAERVS